MQIHTSKQKLAPMAAIDNDVINYAVLDLVGINDLFYVFAVRKPDQGPMILEMVQMHFDSKNDGW